VQRQYLKEGSDEIPSSDVSLSMGDDEEIKGEEPDEQEVFNPLLTDAYKEFSREALIRLVGQMKRLTTSRVSKEQERLLQALPDDENDHDMDNPILGDGYFNPA